MKYSKGDKVRIKSIDWYNQMLSIPEKNVWRNKLTDEFAGIWCGSKVFYVDMCKFCGEVMTIQNIGIDHYIMEEDSCGYEFTDEMIDSIMPKFKVGDKICRVLCGLSNGYLVTSVSDEYYGLKMGEGNVGVLPVAEQDEWVLLSEGDKKIEGLVEEANKLDADAFSDGYDQGYDDGQHDMNEWKLPDGFEFRDENGNVINAQKIVLEKKKSKYPQSFEECCEVLSMPSYYKLRYSTYEHGYHEYTTSKDLGVLQSELDTLGKLLICRDAYWLTAGREMGLEGEWKPDWSDCRKFAIVVEGNEILTDVCLRRNRILVFPTEEMRDEFLKVFRNDIEKCKEFL